MVEEQTKREQCKYDGLWETCYPPRGVFFMGRGKKLNGGGPLFSLGIQRNHP